MTLPGAAKGTFVNDVFVVLLFSKTPAMNQARCDYSGPDAFPGSLARSSLKFSD
jgi:hypothetical protein